MILVPKLSEKRAREILFAGNVTDPVAILAVRGYWRDTMGAEGRNDVGVHDDAWFAVGPDLFLPLQANTDPSRLGWNASIGKNFAMLMPGLHYFHAGAHKGRTPAFRQADDEEDAAAFGIPDGGRFKIWRAKNMDEVLAGTAKIVSGHFAINIHDTQSNDEHRTSSWGCQTAMTSLFKPWATAVQTAMKQQKQKRLPYLLINGPVS